MLVLSFSVWQHDVRLQPEQSSANAQAAFVAGQTDITLFHLNINTSELWHKHKQCHLSSTQMQAWFLTCSHFLIQLQSLCPTHFLSLSSVLYSTVTSEAIGPAKIAKLPSLKYMTRKIARYNHKFFKNLVSFMQWQTMQSVWLDRIDFPALRAKLSSCRSVCCDKRCEHTAPHRDTTAWKSPE